VDVFGPDVQTIGEALCTSGEHGVPFSLSCAIPKAGTYLLVATGGGSFTPTVRHPLLDALQRALMHWSRVGGRTLHVQASAPARSTVCVFIVSGWRAPSPGSLSCGAKPRLQAPVVGFGRHVFARAASARITVRFTRRGQRLLGTGHDHKLTLITSYAVRGDAPATNDRPVILRRRRR